MTMWPSVAGRSVVLGANAPNRGAMYVMLDSFADRRGKDEAAGAVASLAARGGGLHVLHGRAQDGIPRLAQRLGVADAPLYLLAETCLERILEQMARLKPALVIVERSGSVFATDQSCHSCGTPAQQSSTTKHSKPPITANSA